MHPRDRLRRNVKQVSVHPSKRLIRKNKNAKKDLKFIKKIALHPRERLKRKNQLKKDPKVEYIKTVLVHQRDRLSRKIRNAPAKIFVDEQVLNDLPYFNTKIKVNETDKNKRREAVFDKIIKQLPPNRDQYYIQHDKNSDTYRVQKERKVTVIINSDEETNSKAKKKRRDIIPTGALLVTGKIKRKYKQSARKAETNKLLRVTEKARNTEDPEKRRTLDSEAYNVKREVAEFYR